MISRVPDFPSTVAVMVVVPGATAVTTPALLFAVTVATLALELDHPNVRPVREFPAASFGVAVNVTDSPTMRLPPGTETSTDATAGGPEESPPHPATKRNAQADTNARVRRLIDIGVLRGGQTAGRYAEVANAGVDGDRRS
ncbi:MAG TPA: hypothetical protein VFZ21_15955 [Gemmatimonadaceae bacterium]|nr:hypothetical protein [Gemmatimonadaceae bacterium]